MRHLKISCVFVFVAYRFTLRFMAARPLTFFASPKKVSKKSCPRLQVWLTPNFPLCTCSWRRSLVAFHRTALVLAKSIFRSAAPRGRRHGLGVSGSLNKITCKWLRFIYTSTYLQLSSRTAPHKERQNPDVIQS